jgi:tetratricopeptide (TPR) repeat protein
MKMDPINTNLLNWLLIIPLALSIETTLATTTFQVKNPSLSAVEFLVTEARIYYETEQYEQSAALLERALRIAPRNPILWYNLALMHFKQQDWKEATDIARKSILLAGSDQKYKKLLLGNWVLITQACENIDDHQCARDARNQTQALLRNW